MLNQQEMQQAFVIADAAKNRNDYQLANALFAFLLQQHAKGSTQIRIGYEYSEEKTIIARGEDGIYQEFTEGVEEGSPADWHRDNITNEMICMEQYHGLVYLYMGGTPQKPTHYLCIPAPLLRTECLRSCFKYAHREGGFMPRRDHNRIGGVSPKPADITLASIANIFPSFNVPAWVLERPIETAPRIRIGGRGTTKRQIPPIETLTITLPIKAGATHHDIYARIEDIMASDETHEYTARSHEYEDVYDCLSSETKLDESDPRYDYIWFKIVSVEPLQEQPSPSGEIRTRVVLEEEV